MPTLALIGVPLVMAQNVIYCTPIRYCRGLVVPAAAALQCSMTNDSSGMTALNVGADGEFESPAPFIRCTDVAGATVIFKGE